MSTTVTPDPAHKYHGLVNHGATCYLNSVLQVLFMTKDFREAVQRFANDHPGEEFIDQTLKDLFENLLKQTTSTSEILTTLRIVRVYEQCDAAEYFQRILKLTSPKAAQIFHGQLSHRTRCSRCKSETYRDGPFWHLPLGLVDSSAGDYSVEDGIKEFFRSSEFSGENQMYCEQCDTKVDATRENVMKHHPDVLILLLKRFDFSYRHMSYVKINAFVDVPFTLQIPENQKYELYAVVDHFGDLIGGHYTATIKTPGDEDRWYIFNDTWITPLVAHSIQDNENIVKSQSAYLLFYRRKDTVSQDILRNEGPPPTSIQPDTGKASDGIVADSSKTNKDLTEALSVVSDPCCSVDPGVSDSLPDYLVRKQESDEAKITRDDEDKGGSLNSAEANSKVQDPENAELVSEVRNSDVNHDVKPAVIEQPAAQASDNKLDEMNNAQGGVFDGKTDENEQTEKKENAQDAFDDHSKGLSSVGQKVSDGGDDNLKPADVNKKGDKRMKTVVKDQRERATEADKLKPGKKLLKIYDLCRPDYWFSDREQNTAKDDQRCEENFDKDHDEEYAGACHTQSGSDKKGRLTGNQGAQSNEKTRSEILQPNTRGGLLSGVQHKIEEKSTEVLSGGNRSTETENIIETVEEISFGSIKKQAENDEGNTQSLPTADGMMLNESRFLGKQKRRTKGVSGKAEKHSTVCSDASKCQKVSDAQEEAVGIKYALKKKSSRKGKCWDDSATRKRVRRKDKDKRKHLGVFLSGKDRRNRFFGLFRKRRIKIQIRKKSTPS
ncbi:uncharacterized protein [Leuresthes tenuis]|uniref:uncharacterized protein n=1 Tax=Leuresthes tenuis TaxID=355514 RepID=UPI003B50C725